MDKASAGESADPVNRRTFSQGDSDSRSEGKKKVSLCSLVTRRAPWEGLRRRVFTTFFLGPLVTVVAVIVASATFADLDRKLETLRSEIFPRLDQKLISYQANQQLRAFAAEVLAAGDPNQIAEVEARIHASKKKLVSDAAAPRLISQYQLSFDNLMAMAGLANERLVLAFELNRACREIDAQIVEIENLLPHLRSTQENDARYRSSIEALTKELGLLRQNLVLLDAQARPETVEAVLQGVDGAAVRIAELLRAMDSTPLKESLHDANTRISNLLQEDGQWYRYSQQWLQSTRQLRDRTRTHLLLVESILTAVDASPQETIVEGTQAIQTMQKMILQAGLALLILLLVGIVLSMVFYQRILGRQVVNRLATLDVQLRELAKGNLDIVIDDAGKDEIGALSHGVSMLRDALATRKRMELDLLNARIGESEAERASKDAIETSRRKGQLLAAMSHEIRTPLNGIVGLLQLLRDTPMSDKQLRYLATIDTSAMTLLNIINDILDYSKLQVDRLELESITVDIAHLVEDLDTLYRAQRKPIQFKTVVLPGVPRYIKGDPTRIKQVLQNLLSNAFKFTQQGKIILTVNGDISQSRLYFSVRDSGIGISQDKQACLFQEFVQADASTSRIFGGSGLGLSICKMLVERMGGEISVKSEVGKGSTFSFWIPLNLADTEPSHPARDSGSLKLKKPHLTVLVAEDNETNQIVVRAMLGKLGVMPMIANDGLQALELYRKNAGSIDVVLMDCEMPGMDGYEATVKIRECERNLQLPPVYIIALSAHVMDEHKQRALQSGMNQHLSKPIRLEDLCAKLNDAIAYGREDSAHSEQI